MVLLHIERNVAWEGADYILLDEPVVVEDRLEFFGQRCAYYVGEFHVLAPFNHSIVLRDIRAFSYRTVTETEADRFRSVRGFAL